MHRARTDSSLSWAQVEKLGTRKGNLNLADKDPIITKLHCNFFDGSYEIHYCNFVLEKLHIFSFQVKDALGGIEEKQVEVLYYKKDGKITLNTHTKKSKQCLIYYLLIFVALE